MIIAGNWKSNGTVKSTTELVNNVLNKAVFDGEKVEVIVAPIAMHISTVQAILDEKIHVAGQNVSAKGNGAFTGEISAEAFRNLGINWVIIGHSERRTILLETNEIVADKVFKAQECGLSAMVCIGESNE